ncbi:MAG: molybdenum cofactor guanylyltransferase [Opitutaceae bacterium]|jgi:molybdopterin-guanine dinucleotide biosynthesis protein A
MPSFLFSGAIIAGGRSSRMGRDKAFIPVDGQPLVSRQAALLRSLGTDDLIISGRPGTDYGVTGVRVVHDPIPDAGPLAGLVAVLSAARHPWVIVVAVDLPRLDAAFLNRLLTLGGGHTGVVPHGPHGYEPLAALYPRALLPEAEAALQRGEYALHTLVENARALSLIHLLPLGEEDSFALKNWNSPGDVAGAFPM